MASSTSRTLALTWKLIIVSLFIGAIATIISNWVMSACADVRLRPNTPISASTDFQTPSHDVFMFRRRSRYWTFEQWHVDAARWSTDGVQTVRDAARVTAASMNPFVRGAQDDTTPKSIPDWIPTMNESRSGYAFRTDFGWPCRSMSSYWVFSKADSGQHTVIFNRSITVPEKFLPYRDRDLALPAMPLPGFVVNSLCFGGIAFAGIMGVRAGIGSRRLQAGHCPKCCYDCRDPAITTCPECGTHVRSNGVRAA